MQNVQDQESLAHVRGRRVTGFCTRAYFPSMCNIVKGLISFQYSGHYLNLVAVSS